MNAGTGADHWPSDKGQPLTDSRDVPVKILILLTVEPAIGTQARNVRLDKVALIFY